MGGAGLVTDDQPWLAGLVAVAEEEARERGEVTVAGDYVTLALTRDREAQGLLDALGCRRHVGATISTSSSGCAPAARPDVSEGACIMGCRTTGLRDEFCCCASAVGLAH